MSRDPQDMVPLDNPTAWAYQQACKALETHRRRANIAEAEAAKLRQQLKSTNETLDMYARAWARELGGKLITKSHEIDALVLTTRWWQQRIEWAERIILGRQTYELFKEVFDALRKPQ